MPATITSQFRKNNAKNLIANASASGQSYWIGIGKSDSWLPADSTIPFPASSLNYSAEVLRNLITLKKASIPGALPRLMIQSNQYDTNRIYKAYDSMDDQCFISTTLADNATVQYPCYVNTVDAIYLCLKSPLTTASGAAPTHTTAGVVATANNYSWAFLYTATGLFNTTAFKPLPEPYTGITAHTDTMGKIYSGKLFVAYGGTGYTGAPTEAVFHYTNSSNTNLSTTIVISSIISGGVITSATITTSLSTLNVYSNISNVSITVTNGGGSGAQLVPTVTPLGGITDLSAILPCWYVAFYAKVDAAVDGLDLPIINDYRQISLIQNPGANLSAPTDSPTTTNSLDCLNYFNVTALSSGTLDATKIDFLIEECNNVGTVVTNGAKAYLDYIVVASSPNGKVYFHQNYGVNIKKFPSTSPSYFKCDSVTYTYTSIGLPEYSANTGEVLFVENRASITRNSNQSEEIKLIIQL